MIFTVPFWQEWSQDDFFPIVERGVLFLRRPHYMYEQIKHLQSPLSMPSGQNLQAEKGENCEKTKKKPT
jgi:hypothetical protein|tara:strand:+ start:1025 stop:1231 length:207 start_codon:yes stop_codon:yes gene_type:complete